MVNIYEPTPWDVFKKQIQFKEIDFQYLVSSLSKKQNLFMEDIHDNIHTLENLKKLLNSLPQHFLYLEYTKKNLDLFNFSEFTRDYLDLYRERTLPLFKIDTLSLPFWEGSRERERQIIELLKEDHRKKLIFIGGDHIRPGNGVHCFSPDLSQIAVIYSDITNSTSKYNYIEDSELVYGFSIFEMKK